MLGKPPSVPLKGEAMGDRLCVTYLVALALIVEPPAEVFRKRRSLRSQSDKRMTLFAR